MKDLVQGGEIAILVHSVDYVIKCRIKKIEDGIVQFSPIEKGVDMFQVNDPLVLMHAVDGYIQFKSGDVVAVDISENFVEAFIAVVDVKEERRIFERYPVSMAASARRKFSSKRLGLIAKNISQYGMQAISKVDLELDESIDIDLMTGKYMFYFVGKVIWKGKKDTYFEYGFQLTHFDVSTKSLMETYLGKLKDEYRSMYLKAK